MLDITAANRLTDELTLRVTGRNLTPPSYQEAVGLLHFGRLIRVGTASQF